ncbi:hypothetical protein LAZ67_10000137 [Cordylochernes scorpioides]|uniref:SKP1 component POZ domain-containing protein n=1 Tax=Cordylochernes scorpioides TaxID=51811 RepID=A0ABY6KVH8_9ARAC|nr:hypothetical protein LAZ67_10000137 [Cordylochernes scorpioides]
MSNTVEVETSDGKIFRINREIAAKIPQIDENICFGNARVPVPFVDSMCFEQIVIWLTYHKDDPPFDEETQTKPTPQMHVFSEWDANFLKKDHDFLQELGNAAEFLGIAAMVDCIVKHFVNGIKKRQLDELLDRYISGEN